MGRGSELPIKWHLTNEVYGKLISLKESQMVGVRLLLRRGDKMKLPVLIRIKLPLKISSEVLLDYASSTGLLIQVLQRCKQHRLL